MFKEASMQDLMLFVSNHVLLFSAWLVLLILIILNERREFLGGVLQIMPQEAVEMINHQQAIVLDFRSAEAFQKGHILGAKSVQANFYNAKDHAYKRLKNKRVFILIHENRQAIQKIAKDMQAQGFQKIYILKNGMTAWLEAGMPIAKVTEMSAQEEVSHAT